jgi:uncharacterized protein (DUF1330 family)
MNYKNAMEPTDEQIGTFLNDTSQKAVHMVNLLKFRERAIYEDGRDPELSGRDAYMRYARQMVELVTENGGSLQFSGDVDTLMIGEIDELWDAVAIVTYPSAAGMAQITMSERFREIAIHRKAGLEGQLLIQCRSGAMGI